MDGFYTAAKSIKYSGWTLLSKCYNTDERKTNNVHFKVVVAACFSSFHFEESSPADCWERSMSGIQILSLEMEDVHTIVNKC